MDANPGDDKVVLTSFHVLMRTRCKELYEDVRVILRQGFKQLLDVLAENSCKKLNELE